MISNKERRREIIVPDSPSLLLCRGEKERERGKDENDKKGRKMERRGVVEVRRFKKSEILPVVVNNGQ